jgi:hypothetical protein
MTQHNIDDEHHPLKPFWNPKDHIEEIVNLPEFEKLYESFQEEPPAFFGNQSAQKRCRRIYRFIEQAHPYLRTDEDAEAILEEQDTSNRLRRFLDSVSSSVSNTGSAVIINPNRSVVKTVTESHNSTVKESALKKTIQQLEDRISQIRRQLGE